MENDKTTLTDAIKVQFGDFDTPVPDLSPEALSDGVVIVVGGNVIQTEIGPDGSVCILHLDSGQTYDLSEGEMAIFGDLSVGELGQVGRMAGGVSISTALVTALTDDWDEIIDPYNVLTDEALGLGSLDSLPEEDSIFSARMRRFFLAEDMGSLRHIIVEKPGSDFKYEGAEIRSARRAKKGRWKANQI